MTRLADAPTPSAQIHSGEIADLAVSVLATVIGHRGGPGRLILDAGALALSKDRSTAGTAFDAGSACWSMPPGMSRRRGYGWTASIRTTASSNSPPAPLDRFPIGSRVRVLPNHACLTAAMYDRYLVVDDDDQVRDTWRRCNGWGDAGA